ncbi:MAG: hypothetical protein DMD63_14525 [Gemmatimonadetes bacterium]|nr:MAG: hypothetical protein DMD63_14525 [Gemmatimonadota bacterium]
MGTRFGSGALDAVAALTPFVLEVPVPGAALEVPEPVALLSVVEVGPATPPEVFDVVTFVDACVVEPVLLLFAAAADFVPPPLQAVAAPAMTIETRTERYIFPRFGQK